MADKLEPSEKLLAGLVLIVIGLVGLVYRFPGYGMVIGDLRESHMLFYGGGYSVLSFIIIAIFMTVTILGMYIVYNTIKKDP